MRKYGYKRPAATLYTRRRVRTKRPSFFFRFFLLLILAAGLCGGLFVCGRAVWRVFSQVQIADWHIKTVDADGFPEEGRAAVLAQLAPLTGQPFSTQDAATWQANLAKAYPMFDEVEVSRGLFSGKLSVSAAPRRPVARFELPDHSYQYLDSTSTVYADPHGPAGLLQVSLVGPVPEKLDPSFVELVQSLLKLQKSLAFDSLQLDLERPAVTMHLPDGSVIQFGAPQALKQKARRAAQILDKIRGKYPPPVVLNFEFFNRGKVFLTQKPH